ncbi:MAG: hypothetical protein FD126_337 [Elusimicrobia bacterium]|nr:MAG: hypothetical protein FD126_337 [Elusimicrobiota bacterium]
MDSRLMRAIKALKGERCWYVSCGGRVGASFQLAFGGKVKREFPINNKAHSPAFRNNDPEFGLLVWSSWRLSKGSWILATSDEWDERADSAARLRSLKGLRVSQAVAQGAFSDLSLAFSDGKRLDVFCDRFRTRSSIENNWELFSGPNRIGGV